MADIVAYNLVKGTLADQVCSVDAYPLLKALCGTVEANAGVKAYQESRAKK